MKTIGVMEIRRNWSKMLDEITYEGQRFTITKNREPRAVMISVRDMRRFEELLRLNDERRTKQ
jgi:prevent-host-death family protein